jgi:hypothetical protein
VSAASQQQLQQGSDARISVAYTGSLPHTGVPSSAGVAGHVRINSGEAENSHYGRPYSTASTCYSPKFFMNGEEVPADAMQLPPQTASINGSACQHCCHQQMAYGQQRLGGQPAVQPSLGSPHPQHAWGADSSAACEQPGSSSGCSSCCSGQGAGAGGLHAARPFASSRPSSCNVGSQQPGQLPRTRATTYSAAFSPAGFNFQQYMDSLKLAGSMRPGSAAAAFSSGQQQRAIGRR